MLNITIIRKMSTAVMKKIIDNAVTAEKRLVELRNKLEYVKKIKIEERIQELTSENAALKTKVVTAKNELIRLETLNGIKQYPIPAKSAAVTSLTNNKLDDSVETAVPDIKPKPAKKEKSINDKKVKDKVTTDSESVIDVRKLDFRIGKIVEINKHPDADTLYVEKIDCGEDKPRTVVSGLVNHVPIDEMRDRIVMILCNLKPVKMRGVTSEAMVMCASSPEKIEVLIPPTGAAPGDLVCCETYPREPEPVLNPKKKIFETCAPDLKTNEAGVACFKGSPLIVEGKGPVVAPTLKGVTVR